MPEIAEVARVVHYLRQSLVGKTLKSVVAQDDTIVFGKVGTSGAEFMKALTGKKVVDAGQQGKYFWLIMSSPPHPVMHFGMTGWLHIRGKPSIHYRPKEPDAEEVWPPKYWKFTMETEGEPKVEAAFTDARRLARVRLLDCAAGDIRKTTPLKENGPDPVIDRDILTEEWFARKMNSKHVPVKALLLDQANISGIGNWVGDEVLYQAKIHPEQYSNTFSAAQLKQLHTSILHVCKTAVDLLGDSSKFPDEWLFNHRWGKGKKDASKTLPNGEKITFLTVGGRTSCVVPSVQKKTGAVAGDVEKGGRKINGDAGESDEGKPLKSTKRKAVEKVEDFVGTVVEPLLKPVAGKGRKTKVEDPEVSGEQTSKSKKQKVDATAQAAVKSNTKRVKREPKEEEDAPVGRRRSGRVSKG